MNQRPAEFAADLARYEQFMHVLRNRWTSRQFNPQIAVPREHVEMVLEASRHAPSGARPWHYIAVTDPAVKRQIADYFVDEQRRRAELKMKFPTPDYRGLETAPGFMSRDDFNMASYTTVEEIDAWVCEERHKVMYRDESEID
jgi:nitroreductase